MGTNLREENLRIEAGPLEVGIQLIDRLSEGEVPPQILLLEEEEVNILLTKGVTEAQRVPLSEEVTEAQVIEEVHHEEVIEEVHH